MKTVDIFVRIMHYTEGNGKLCKPLYMQLCYKLCTGSNWKHEDIASVQKCTLITVQEWTSTQHVLIILIHIIRPGEFSLSKTLDS